MKKLTKKACVEQMQAIIDKYGYKEEFSPVDFVTACDLTNWWEWPLDAIRRSLPHKREVEVLEHGKDWVVWSWDKRVKRYGVEYNIKNALREALAEQHREVVRNSDGKCADCHATDKKLTAEHSTKCGGLKFEAIKSAFLSEYPDLEKHLYNTGVGEGWKLNAEMMPVWMEFHNKRVFYEVLCGPCNSRRG